MGKVPRRSLEEVAFEPDLVGFQLEGLDGKGMADDGNSMAKVLKGERTRRGAGKQTAGAI